MEAAARVCAWLEQHGLGGRKVNYKLRDWLFARQARLVTVWFASGNMPGRRLVLPCRVVAFLHHVPDMRRTLSATGASRSRLCIRRAPTRRCRLLMVRPHFARLAVLHLMTCICVCSRSPSGAPADEQLPVRDPYLSNAMARGADTHPCAQAERQWRRPAGKHG